MEIIKIVGVYIPAFLFWLAVGLKLVGDAQKEKHQQRHDDDGK